jgi:hypothetical protein
MDNSQTIGIDAAKRVFCLPGENAAGKAMLLRERLLPFLANQPASAIASEARCGASFRGSRREFLRGRFGPW